LYYIMLTPEALECYRAYNDCGSMRLTAEKLGVSKQYLNGECRKVIAVLEALGTNTVPPQQNDNLSSYTIYPYASWLLSDGPKLKTFASAMRKYNKPDPAFWRNR